MTMKGTLSLNGKIRLSLPSLLHLLLFPSFPAPTYFVVALHYNLHCRAHIHVRVVEVDFNSHGWLATSDVFFW